MQFVLFCFVLFWLPLQKERYFGIFSEFTENRKHINLSPKAQFFSKPTRESLHKTPLSQTIAQKLRRRIQIRWKYRHKLPNGQTSYEPSISNPTNTDKFHTEGPILFKTHKTITHKTPLSASSLSLPHTIFLSFQSSAQNLNAK